MGQKLTKSSQRNHPPTQPFPVTNLNSLVGSTSLFNYKCLVLENTVPNKPSFAFAASHHRRRPESVLSETNSSVDSSNISATTSTSTQQQSSSSQKTSTPKLDRRRQQLTVLVPPHDHRFSTLSNLSSISTAATATATATATETETVPDCGNSSVIVNRLNNSPPSPQQSSFNMAKRNNEMVNNRRSSFKEKLSKINKRWSVSKLIQTSTHH